MAKDEKIVIDAAHMQVDRSTETGKQFAAMQKMAANQSDTPMGKFINQVAAYAEAATVVTNALPKKDADAALEKLRDKFDKSLS